MKNCLIVIFAELQHSISRKLATSTALLLIASCTPSSTSQYEAAGEHAAKALREMEAVTQVGVTLTLYQSKLVEAQTKVNEAVRELPPKSLVVENINMAMMQYVDAGRFWELTRSSRTFCAQDSDPDGTKMVRTYAAITLGTSECLKTTQGKTSLQGDPKAAMQKAWAYAVDTRLTIEKRLKDHDFSATKS